MLRVRLLKAFEEIAEAEKKRGDVGGLVNELNHALDLLKKGGAINLAEAESIVEAVLVEITMVEEQGIIATQNLWLRTGVILGLRLSQKRL